MWYYSSIGIPVRGVWLALERVDVIKSIFDEVERICRDFGGSISRSSDTINAITCFFEKPMDIGIELKPGVDRTSLKLVIASPAEEETIEESLPIEKVSHVYVFAKGVIVSDLFYTTKNIFRTRLSGRFIDIKFDGVDLLITVG